MQKLPHTRSCFVCGESNVHGLNLRMHVDGARVHVRFVPRPEHMGFKQVVHGGILSTVLDEIMVWACAVQMRQFAYCAELNVRFIKSARPGEPLVGTAELIENRRGRILIPTAELKDESGALIATATGKYMPIKGDIATEMLADVVPEPDTFKL